jgi:hypothetical protein
VLQSIPDSEEFPKIGLPTSQRTPSAILALDQKDLANCGRQPCLNLTKHVFLTEVASDEFASLDSNRRLASEMDNRRANVDSMTPYESSESQFVVVPSSSMVLRAQRNCRTVARFLTHSMQAWMGGLYACRPSADKAR